MPDFPNAFEAFDFRRSPAIVAAVSGGSDSTALLLLLKRHLDRLGCAAKLVAVTIDHGLRRDTAAEAGAVADLARKLGIAHRTIAWSGPKPASGIASAARTARYRLLAGAAGAVGATLIVTGHTADDQAETVAMRQMRGDGRGLAGMAPATLHDGAVWITRPLLATRREALRDILRDAGIAWIDDPTNTDPAYERARIRAALACGADRHADIVAAARTAAVARESLGARAALLIAAHAARPAPALLRLAPAFVSGQDPDAALYALRILLSAVGGANQLPTLESASSLFEALGRPGSRATLSRTVVERRPDDMILMRERRGLPAEMPARDGDVWDGRWRLRKSPGAGDACVRPCQAAPPGREADAWTIPPRLIRAAAATRPAFTLPENGLPAPGWSAHAVAPPWLAFMPSFDFAPAQALAALLGADAPPPPPFAHHNVRTP